jgi:predicted GH43/DUF377 family glycosyl hydrolase
MHVKRTGITIRSTASRVVFRPFEPANPERILKIIARVMALSESEVDDLLAQVMEEFRERHQRLRDFFQLRFNQVRQHLLTDQAVSANRQFLIGAFFTQEFALESAALFNPSIVWHPDQTGMPDGSRRFILSLRATGEGHLSSITFRSGVIDAQNAIRLDPTTRYVTAPETVPNTRYDKALFHRKLFEIGVDNRFAEQVLGQLEDLFTLTDLEENIAALQRKQRIEFRESAPAAQTMLALAKSNYEFKYTPEHHLSERIIFPSSPTEQNGIEDARFVQFHEDNGSTVYFATYTAYDGKVILPQLLETDDFLHFKLRTLNGTEVRNKGMALFPRKIKGMYAMLSRQDGENIYIMFSDVLHFWYSKKLIMKPTFPWEFVQLGNCGSPIETEAGWLVLSHGVGAIRKYSMGAFLLDREDPTKVIARTEQPLLVPNANEREGYVPNVVYSCGGLVHGRELIIPYAMSDQATTFATIGLDDLLGLMKRVTVS